MLRKYCVSVTCEVDEGRIRWWLTKESGQVPLSCREGLGCASCVSGRWRAGGPRALARSYVIVKVVTRLRYTAWSNVAIGLLSCCSLERVRSETLPKLVLASRKTRSGVRRRWECFSEQYAHTLFLLRHAGERPSKCWVCGAGSVGGIPFVLRNCYDGVVPFGVEHWFLGVTDAVGEVSDWQKDWLLCRR